MRGYRQGANKSVQNQIRRFNADGRSVEDISRFVRVVPKVVQAFVNHFNGGSKETLVEEVKDATENKAAPEATEEADAAETESTADSTESESAPEDKPKRRGRPPKSKSVD